MAGKVRIRRGNKAALPPLALGEFGYALDSKELAIGGLSGNEFITSATGIGGQGVTGAQGIQGVTGASGFEAPNVYNVPSQYSTIQAAIDKAHLIDGHTSSATSAIIQIAPGSYNENLTLRSGVYLLGLGTPYNTRINGRITYQATINQSRSQNRISLEGITLNGNNTGPTLELLGSFASNIVLNQFRIFNNEGNTQPSILVNSSNISSGIDFYGDCALGHDDPGGRVIDVISGSVNIYDPSSRIQNSLDSVSTVSTIRINNGYFNIYGSNIGVTAPAVFELVNGNANVSINNSTIQNSTPNGRIVHFNGDGYVSFNNSNVQLFDSNQKVASTTFGGTIAQSNTTFGTNNNTSAFTDPGIEIYTIGKTKLQSTTNWGEVRVGGVDGFGTINDAITYIQARNALFKTIVLAPGLYNEDVDLSFGISLVGDTYSENSDPCMVNGQITFAPIGQTPNIYIENIQVTAPTGKKCFEYGGDFSAFPVFSNCKFFKEADTVPAFSFNNPTNASMPFTDCYFSVNDAIAFDLNNVPLYLHFFGHDNNFLTTFFGGSLDENLPYFKLSENSHVAFTRCFSNCLSTRFMYLVNNSSVKFAQSQIQISAPYGEILYYANNTYVEAHASNFIISQSGEVPAKLMLARDGMYASGTITIVNNSFDVGDSVSIAGESFEPGIDFTIGPNVTQTAKNLAEAINANSPLQDIVMAIYDETPTLKIRSFKNSAAGNSITLSKVDGSTLNFTLSGATLTGGANGSGGIFLNNSNIFEWGYATIIQDTIDVQSKIEVPTSI